MRYFIGVEATDPHNKRSLLEEFRRQAEPKFPDVGTQLYNEHGKTELILSCPSRAVRDKLRDFIRSSPGVREPIVPPATLLTKAPAPK